MWGGQGGGDGRTHKGWSGSKRLGGVSLTHPTAEGIAWAEVRRGTFRTAEPPGAASMWVCGWGGPEPGGGGCKVRGQAGGVAGGWVGQDLAGSKS